MDSLIDNETESKLEPIGIRVLGETDPKTLSITEFEGSPDALFHGAKRDFTFNSKYNYSSTEYLTEMDGSQTLGQGFYTTDNKIQAANYSLLRQHNEKADKIVVTVLPYNARVFDFRSSTDQKLNAKVPRNFLDQWFEYYRKYYFDKEARKNQPWYISSAENEYWRSLIELKNSVDINIDLRALLGSGGNSNINAPAPVHAGLFSKFMNEQGLDGLIYNEGGEGNKGSDHSTYVFYNLNKIGTYNSWHRKDNQ